MFPCSPGHANSLLFRSPSLTPFLSQNNKRKTNALFTVMLYKKRDQTEPLDDYLFLSCSLGMYAGLHVFCEPWPWIRWFHHPSPFVTALDLTFLPLLPPLPPDVGSSNDWYSFFLSSEFIVDTLGRVRGGLLQDLRRCSNFSTPHKYRQVRASPGLFDAALILAALQMLECVSLRKWMSQRTLTVRAAGLKSRVELLSVSPIHGGQAT